MARQKSSRLVYSTDPKTTESRPQPQGSGKKGGRKKGGGNLKAPPGFPSDGIVRVWRQTSGRKGKGVTMVTGLGLGPAELAKLAGELKKACGSGGTVKAGTIEIQGDHRDRIIEDLRGRGLRVKKAGG
ncbi:MAG: stress response translation initiation inhibitor YciH [Acidobacteriota bacterium]